MICGGLVFRSFGVAGAVVAVGFGGCECLFDKWWLSRAGLRAAWCVDLATRMEKHRRCLISPPGRRSADAS